MGLVFHFVCCKRASLSDERVPARDGRWENIYGDLLVAAYVCVKKDIARTKVVRKEAKEGL